MKQVTRTSALVGGFIFAASTMIYAHGDVVKRSG